LIKFDKFTFEAASHVAETGGKQSEIVKCFQQHVTPVPHSESFKPAQEHTQQTTKRNSSERINMILKIAKSQANELTAEPRASLGQKGKEILDAYRVLQTIAEEAKESISQPDTVQLAMLCSRKKGNGQNRTRS
jgi:hypothetical protein